MTFRLKFGILLLTLLLAGCVHQRLVSKTPADYDAETIPARIKAESDQLAKIHKETIASVEKPQVKSVDVTPVMPTYDPLEDRIVSFSLVNEDFKMVLYSLAQAVGMNLIIDPDVKTEEKRLTLNFENVSAAMVLREVLDTFNLFYTVKGNVIRIKPFQEKIFMLNFLDTSIDADFLVGGDVLGETEGLEGLTGSFKLTGKGASSNEGNPYDIVEKMVQKILSPEGKYVLNRMAGTLYVRDRPKSLRSISRFVNHSREVLSRQIHIVARIIEVVLRDEFDYGIDWQVLWSEAKLTDDAEATVSWSPEEGLNVQAIIKHFNIDAAVDALQTFGDVKIVSNPNIRAKHGKPALISVGTSISYTKSTSTTILDGIQRDLITDVEVSKVFDGLVLGVIPFIQNSGKITLLINPIKSDVDPESLELVPVGTQQVTLPVVNIKEVSTTITLNSGDAVILGGLIDSQDVVVDSGVPGLSSIPVLGYLFKDQFKREENRELVDYFECIGDMSVIYNTLTKLKRPSVRDVSPGEFRLKNNAQFFKVPKTRKFALGMLVFVALIALGGGGSFYGLYSMREDAPPNSSTTNVVITKSISTQQQPQNQPVMQSSVNSPERQIPQYTPPVNPERIRNSSTDKQAHRKMDMKTAALKKSPSPNGKGQDIAGETKNHAVRNTKFNDSMTSSALATQADEKKIELKSRTAENARRVSLQRSLSISRLIGDLQTAIATGNSKRTDELFEQLVALKGNQNSYVLKMKAYWHMQQGEYPPAMILLKNVLDHNSDDLEAGINMAILEIKTKRLSAAVERLAKLREIYPDDTRIPEIMVTLK